MPDKSQQIIQRMVKKIARKFDPDKIILFGSYARGVVTRDSDIDLLVIMPFEGSNLLKAAEIYRTVGVVGIPKDILVYTPDQVKKYGRVAGMVMKAALREGKVLYERKS